jgi:hypothetical protein
MRTNISQEIADLEQQVLELADQEDALLKAEATALQPDAAAAQRSLAAASARRAPAVTTGSAATTRLVRQQAALTQLLHKLEGAGRAAPRLKTPSARPRTAPAVPAVPVPRPPTAAQLGPEIARLRLQAQEAATAQAQLHGANESLRKQIAICSERERRLMAARCAAEVDRDARAAEAAAALLLARNEREEVERAAEANAALRRQLVEACEEAKVVAADGRRQARRAARCQAALQQRVDALEGTVCGLQGEAVVRERCVADANKEVARLRDQLSQAAVQMDRQHHHTREQLLALETAHAQEIAALQQQMADAEGAVAAVAAAGRNIRRAAAAAAASEAAALDETAAANMGWELERQSLRRKLQAVKQQLKAATVDRAVADAGE